MTTSTQQTASDTAGPNRHHISLTTRALLALCLMIGFYALAIGLSAALLYVPYAEWVYANRLHANLAIFCIGGAGAILWAIIPRPDRFSAPGPRLDAHSHPQLFQALDGIATLTGQRMPAEVYLVSNLNAWVSDRGGVLGFGSRRIMGLGLPLMQLLTVAELRAVLAHEFGHFFAGDTKLGPWIYRTRAAIGRTLQSLHGSILQQPFIAYGKLFMRISHAVSRKQEFAADRLAARTVGARALIEGLKKLHGTAPAFESYWRGEVVPLLCNGLRPPIAEGFARFVQADPIVRAVDQQIAHELAEGKADTYDTHPSLRERIAAVQDLAHDDEPVADTPAVSLIGDVDALELDLLQSISTDAGKLRPIPWQEVGAAFYVPLWQRTAVRHAAGLKGLTLAGLPEALTGQDGLSSRFQPEAGEELSADARKARAAFVIGAALATLLIQHGWQIRILPGESVQMERDGRVMNPFNIVDALREQRMSAEAWRDLCASAGIADIDLGEIRQPVSG